MDTIELAFTQAGRIEPIDPKQRQRSPVFLGERPITIHSVYIPSPLPSSSLLLSFLSSSLLLFLSSSPPPPPPPPPISSHQPLQTSASPATTTQSPQVFFLTVSFGLTAAGIS
jgi:hypothetical protein